MATAVAPPVARARPRVAYKTRWGEMIAGTAESALTGKRLSARKGQVQLVFTSPPFPLNRKKKYGNLSGDSYVEWLASFAILLREYLTTDGSIVLELGNSWNPGSPTMSTLALRALLAFMDAGEFHLCQQFICHNPARLPSPVQWVNRERIRVKDSFTHVWWMSPTEYPRADNKAVLRPYSASMLKLLDEQDYNPGKRPSEHNIGPASFLKDHGGAIPSNVLSLTNTISNDRYHQYCRANHLRPHPARMQAGLPEFFIKFLTLKNDLVLDPFAGSNTTGSVAQALGRRWLSIEADENYAEESVGRFSRA